MNNIKNIIKIIHSVQKHDINKLKITTEGNKIIISKTKTNKAEIKKISRINRKEVRKEQVRDRKLINSDKSIAVDKVNTKTAQASNTYSTIISPMVGTFYKSPAPNENPFIEIGDTIIQKQIVCIIEAMKLMNEIESEVKGEIVEILVKDGDIVDCGQALMKVKVK